MFLCKKKVPNIAEEPAYLGHNFYGSGRKTLPEDMVCFQQAATRYLKYYKESNMHQPWKSQQLSVAGDDILLKHEMCL